MRHKQLLGRASVMALAVLLMAATAATQTAPAAPNAPDAAALTKLLNDFLAGAGRNDAAMHNRFWADDLIYTSATGTRRGKAEIMNGLGNSRQGGTAPTQTAPATTYSAEDIRIQQYGDTAIVAFRLVANGPAAAPNAPGAAGQTAPGAATPSQAPTPTVQRFFNTGTFLRRNGEWRAVAWQATRIPDAPATQAR